MDITDKIKTCVTLVFLILLLEVNHHVAKQSTQKANAVEEVSDFKEFKKLLRTKNNVLVCFVSSSKQASPIIKIFREAAESVKGQGTMLLIDCSGESKKMCKKLKVNPNPFVLKHYKDGEYHKDYDRLQTAQSMVKFMRDPAGDIPWEEDSAAEDVMHISDALMLNRFLKKELKPTLVMFYAPWCGFCKQLKPEYAAAAAQLKGHSILAAIDVNRPENTVIRHQYNITGFPTMLYFENGYQKYIYEGENNKDGLIGFMKNPRKPAGKPKGSEWAQVKSEVVHLTSDTFDAFLKLEPSVLVMFYAPWCGHCTRMKPEYEKAAETLKKENIPGALAAVDATKETVVASKYSISGYPSVKYFKNGEFAFDTNLRDAGKILEFMRNPRKPPPPPPPEQPWSEEPSEVVHLDAETFKPFLKKKKHTLVMFYAPSEPGSWETHLFLHVQSFRGGGGFGADSWPISAFGLASVFDLIWCGHCKKAKPEFVAAAEEFKDDSKVEFAAVDCTLHSSVCSALEVKGYPTIKYFHYYNKETKNYSGGRVLPLESSPRSASLGIFPTFSFPWNIPHLQLPMESSPPSASLGIFPTFSFPWTLTPPSASLGLFPTFIFPWNLPHLHLPMESSPPSASLVIFPTFIFPWNLPHLQLPLESSPPSSSHEIFPTFSFPWNLPHLQLPLESSPPSSSHGIFPTFIFPWNLPHLQLPLESPPPSASHGIFPTFSFPWNLPHLQLPLESSMESSPPSASHGIFPTFSFSWNLPHLQLPLESSSNGSNICLLKADLVNFMLDPLNPLAGMINTSTVEAADKPPTHEWGTFLGAEHVVHLNDDSFDKVIGEGNPVLVMFYAPWCGHCKKMKPAYSEAALKLHKDKSPSYLAAVDSTVNPRMTERYKIQAFPTLKLFNKGKFASEYEKPRTAEDITAFMKSVEDASIKKKDEL
uniref:Thioredoxin domain-containing protein n=1 Tax=Timema douglasi TaxID=61478 RepID=A0A7R8Z8L2_TIMDO|nr:unnamed protein product [Timema douglasi]